MVTKPWYVRKPKKSSYVKKFALVRTLKNQWKPRSPLSPQNIPLSGWWPKQGQRGGAGVGPVAGRRALRRWSRTGGGTPRAPVQSFSSVRPGFRVTCAQAPSAGLGRSSGHGVWCGRRRAGSCPRPRRPGAPPCPPQLLQAGRWVALRRLLDPIKTAHV
jgi:hypothetical protein